MIDQRVRGDLERQPQLRILCISPLFPPVVNSESICGGKAVKGLLERGVEVCVLYCSDIYGTRGPEDDSRLWKSLNDVRIDVPLPAGKNRIQSLLMAARYRTYFYTRWLDLLVRQAARLHAVRKFDLVYSRSVPVIAHYAGYWCARNLKLPWVVSMSDPWDAFTSPVAKRSKISSVGRAISKHWFRKTLCAADMVIYPTARLHEYHNKCFDVHRHAEIVPHIGYSHAPTSEPPHAIRPGIFHLVHAGKLGSNEKPCRPTISLLTALSEFLKIYPKARQSIHVTLVGPEDPNTESSVRSLGLDSIVKNAGPVNYEESLRYIASATVCVLVEADLDEGIFLPSKLADYICARKPILALSPRVGVVADLASHGGIVRVDHGDSNAIKGAIADLYFEFKQNILNARVPGNELVNLFDSRRVAIQLLQILEKAHAAHRSPFRSLQSDAVPVHAKLEISA